MICKTTQTTGDTCCTILYTSLRRELLSSRRSCSCSSLWTPRHHQGFQLCRSPWSAPARTAPEGVQYARDHTQHTASAHQMMKCVFVGVSNKHRLWTSILTLWVRRHRSDSTDHKQGLCLIAAGPHLANYVWTGLLTKLAASMMPSSTGWVQSRVNFRICFLLFPPCLLTTCFFWNKK